MKFQSKRKLIGIFAAFALMILTEAGLQAQDGKAAASSNHPASQQPEKAAAAENSADLQQQDQKTSADKQTLKEGQKSVKKIKNSSPDLSRRKGARPPSISRPFSSGMPRGAGKPAGITKPGRR